jgi:hypothetical protein
MMRYVALAAGALLTPSAASAQGALPPVEDIASDLAFRYCPLFLANKFPLNDNTQLDGLGFEGEIKTQPNARFGEIQYRAQNRNGLQFSFGGTVGKICQVLVVGNGSASVDAAMRKRVSKHFAPDPSETRVNTDGSRVETLMARVSENAVLKIQFVTRPSPPTAGFQMFMTDQ